RRFAKFWILPWACLIAIAPALAGPQADAPSAPPTKPAEDKKADEAGPPAEANKPEEFQFIRVRKDEDGTPIALETAIVRYVPATGEDGVSLDLIGAVHVGDREYYETLNKRFKQYDALL